MSAKLVSLRIFPSLPACGERDGERGSKLSDDGATSSIGIEIYATKVAESIQQNQSPPYAPSMEGTPLPNLLPAGGEKEPEALGHAMIQGFNARAFSRNSLPAGRGEGTRSSHLLDLA